MLAPDQAAPDPCCELFSLPFSCHCCVDFVSPGGDCLVSPGWHQYHVSLDWVRRKQDVSGQYSAIKITDYVKNLGHESPNILPRNSLVLSAKRGEQIAKGMLLELTKD